MAQALVPLKDLVQAKSRLAGLLRPSERRALVQAMVEDVLGVLAGHPAIGRITLVSDDPCATLLANQYGTTHWSESMLGCSGLNTVIASASARLLRECDEPLLVLHGDLPLLTASDISAALMCQRQLGGLVIGCDRSGTGTNLLAFDAASVPVFYFGPASAARHREDAHRAGLPVEILHRSGIGLDIDDAQDMAELLAALGGMPAGHTCELLRGTRLGARIGLALATLPESAINVAGETAGEGTG